MSDEELIARLLDAPADGLGTENLCIAAADRIEALVKERDEGAKDYCALMDRYDALFVRAERLEAAADYILDGMGIDAPDYEIDPDDDFLDAASSDWVRDVLTRLAAALKGADRD